MDLAVGGCSAALLDHLLFSVKVVTVIAAGIVIAVYFCVVKIVLWIAAACETLLKHPVKSINMNPFFAPSILPLRKDVIQRD